MRKGPLFIIILVIAVIVGYLLMQGSEAPEEIAATPTVNTEEVSESENVAESTEPATEDTAASEENVEEESVAALSYTLADIALHATPQDCWFAMEGKVYDVSEYIAGGLHPGEEAILEGCGKDATALYTQDPDESGNEDSHEHSGKARNFLNNYYIGELQ